MIHKIYTVRKNFIIGCEIIHFYINNRYKCSRICRKDCISNSNHYGYESIIDRLQITKIWKELVYI
jgi:hypothetical protein